MGVRTLIDGQEVLQEGYRIDESSTPLAGGDSSGGVGTINVTYAQKAPGGGPLPRKLHSLALGKRLDFLDTNKGTTVGTIRESSLDRNSGLIEVTANSRLGDFMIETQVEPFVGTLGGAFTYYCSIANIDTDIIVDAEIYLTPVSFPGWNGNLWNGMKQLASAIQADLNLISGIVTLRPVRRFNAITGRNIEATDAASGTQLALKQEVVWYKTHWSATELIYPPPSEERPRVLSVNAGETSETVLDIAASVTSISQPVAQLSVAPDYDASSVYTVIGNDNIVIPPAQWADYGGDLKVTVEPDTRHLRVKLTGASGLVQINGDAMTTFRIAMSAGTSESTYPTLRIVGEGVHLKPQSLIIPTGVDPWMTAQEFAPTIDNIFLNDLSTAFSAGTRGASRYSGKVLSLSASVVAVNRRGERGIASRPSYGQVQDMWSALTYAGVQTANAGKTYNAVALELYELVADDIENQAFGNVPGARVWDRESRRFYRVRSATTEWGQISVECDNDLTQGDVQNHFSGMTYGDVSTQRFAGLTYDEAYLMGLA